MLCGVYCVWIAAAGLVGGCAGRAPSVVCLSRVRGCACAGCVAAGIWIGAVTGRCAAVVCSRVSFGVSSFGAVCINFIQYVLARGRMHEAPITYRHDSA